MFLFLISLWCFGDVVVPGELRFETSFLTAPAELNFGRVVAITRDAGMIWVLDYEGSVYGFDEEGVLKRRFGRQGEGPGEFRGALSMAVHPDLIFVYDPFRSLVSIFDKTGFFVENVKLPGQPMETSFAVDRLGQMFMSAPQKPKPLITYGTDGEPLQSFGTGRGRQGKASAYHRDFSFVHRIQGGQHGHLMVAWQAVPVVESYTPDGKLLARLDLSGVPPVAERLQEMDAHLKSSDAGLPNLIRSVGVHQKGMDILLHSAQGPASVVRVIEEQGLLKVDGCWQIQVAGGGLITALAPIGEGRWLGYDLHEGKLLIGRVAKPEGKPSSRI